MKKTKKYLDKFLNLRSSADILGILYPISSGTEKEVSEAWTVYKKLDYIRENPDNYNVLDLCAGNPVTSLLIRFNLPVTYVTSIDKKPVVRNYSKIRNYEYIEKNIYDEDIFKYINEKTVIISTHPCKKLAIRVVEIFKNSNAKALHLMPCCHGVVPDWPQKRFLIDTLGKYLTWCYWLASQCDGTLEVDTKCLSPKNVIISSKTKKLETKEDVLKKLETRENACKKLQDIGIVLSTKTLTGKTTGEWMEWFNVTFEDLEAAYKENK